ncbi:hypothetical protein V8F20_008858 [Naviculisporaceae sp. PSN 640]
MPDPYIIGDSSPFLKRVLIPFWVIRIIIMLAELAIYGLFIGAVGAYSRELDEVGVDRKARGTVIGIIAVIMVLILICLILDIVCIVKRSRRTLSPRFFLIVNVLQTTLWLVFFILSAVGAQSGLSIGIGVVILYVLFFFITSQPFHPRTNADLSTPRLSFLGLLIYASVVFHQFRTGKLGGGKYEPAFNPAGTGGIANQTPQPYAPTTPYGQADYGVPMPQQTVYGQQTAQSQVYGYGQPQTDVKPQQSHVYGYEQQTQQQPVHVQQTGYGYELPNRNPV